MISVLSLDKNEAESPLSKMSKATQHCLHVQNCYNHFERIDIHVSLIMFKETLESYLFGSSSSYSTQTHEKEFHVFMCIQLRSFFRGLLSKKGTIIFDELLDQRAHLTRAYA